MSPDQLSKIRISKIEWKWQDPPWQLLAYVCFSVIATALQLSVFFAPKIFGTIVPFTSWTGLFVYCGSLQFVLWAIFTQCRFFVPQVAQDLIRFAPFGLLWIALRAGREDFGNPYLMFSPFQPLITIGLPLFWAALLSTRSMKQWVESANITLET